MTDITSYWPRIHVGDETFELLSIHFGVDFGGRQAQCEFQGEQTLKLREATYYYLKNEWSSEDFPLDAPLTAAIRSIFSVFDNGQRL